MSERPNRRLVVSADGSSGSVHLDGENISNAVRGLDIRLQAGQPPQVTLDVLVFELAGEAADPTVHIVDEARALLIALGWTPPEET